MPHTDSRGRRARKLSEVIGTPRSPLLSLWRSAKDRQEPPAPTIAAGSLARRLRARIHFLGKAVWDWLTQFVGNIIKPKRALPAYAAGDTGVYRIGPNLRIALASDWGTGTSSAYAVADKIRALTPHITIHMGDVYYSGTAMEYDDYFMPPDCWPRGGLQAGSPTDARGTYILNANHEMYSGGEGYFGRGLPGLGQTTSYWCLANDDWRIVALDTGYACSQKLAKMADTLFGWIPIISSLVRDRTKLVDQELEWFQREVFKNGQDTRPIILLTHHQPFSAFDKRVYRKLLSQLSPYLDRIGLWFWGHEHRFVGYQPFTEAGSPLYARCIGHGGMPVELGWKQDTSNSPMPLFFDLRQCPDPVGKTPVGFCGFASLDFAGPELTVTYQDENGTELLRESFVVEHSHLRHQLQGWLQHPDFHVQAPSA